VYRGRFEQRSIVSFGANDVRREVTRERCPRLNRYETRNVRRASEMFVQRACDGQEETKTIDNT